MTKLQRGDACRIQVNPRKNPLVRHFLQNGAYATAPYDSDDNVMVSDLIWDSLVIAPPTVLLVLSAPVKRFANTYIPVLAGSRAVIFQESELELLWRFDERS